MWREAGVTNDETPTATKFCRECGEKIAIDSKYCEKCGAQLMQMQATQPETAQELAPSVTHKNTGSKSTTVALLIILLVVIWAVSPIFVANPTPAFLLTNTDNGGIFTLKLQNLAPWPVVFD